MNRKDLTLSAVLGFLSAAITVLVYRIVGPLAMPALMWSSLLIVPALFVLGLYIASLIARLNQAFYGLGKFIEVGIFNTLIDFAIFNALIALSGSNKGHWIVLFKSVSFVAALINSYFWNKLWTFKKASDVERKNEFMIYAVVTVIGFAINVGITTLVANHIQPIAHLSQVQWDNAAAVLATLASLFWNFFGYKLIVFKDK